MARLVCFLLRPSTHKGRTFSSKRLDGTGLSYIHQPGTQPLQYVTLGQLLERAAQQYGDREAVVSVQEGVRLSFRDLLRQADSVAAGLGSLGLKPGDRVALWAPNSWKWVVSRLGLARAGMIAVDMNPLYREQEALHCLRLARVAAVVAAEEHRGLRYHEILAAVAPEVPKASGGVIRSAALPDLRTFITLADKPVPGAVCLSQLEDSVSAEDIQTVRDFQKFISPDSNCNVQFSSGTTGKPKAIMIRHMSLVNNAFFIGRRLHMEGKHHKICVQTPFFHAYGSVFAFCGALVHGATMVLPSAGYDPMCSLEAIRGERCSILTGTPTMHVDAVRQLEASGETLDCLEVAITGGAPITPELSKRMLSVLGIKRLCNIYGLSEATAVSFQGVANETTDQVTNTVGKIGEHVEAKVVNEQGHLVPFGTPGELYLRGYHTMVEYYQDEEATRNNLIDGWVKTGDKFILQEDGYGRVVGRLKDLIIRGGENIFPGEIEDLLATHPEIIEVQVVGVPDERMGEEICACIRTRGEQLLTAQQIRTFCFEKISKFKIPRYCIVIKEFPKTVSGKVQKTKLREHCEKLLERKELSDAFTAR